MTHTLVVDGWIVEPYAASEVEVGWTIIVRGYGLCEVLKRRVEPPRVEGEDSQLVLHVDKAPFVFKDEGGLTVYKVVRELEVA